MIKEINNFRNKQLNMERLKPALIGGGLVCAQSLYYWDKLNAGTNCQPAMLTISGMAIAALQGIAIRAFSEDQYWRERPNFLAATTCVLIEQPALWFTDTKPLTILASIVKQITCHLIVGIVAPYADDVLRQKLMIDNGRSKTWVGFAKMITQIGLTRYFTVSAPNKSLANIATFRQGFLIASSYYLPNLLGLSHRIPPTYSASIHPQRVSTLPRNAQAISVYQENDDSAQFLQMIPVSEEVASQFSSPSIPYDPIKYITGRMQAIVEAQEVGNPLPSEGNFVAVTSLLKGVFKHAGNPQYVGEDGKPYYEPKWGSVTDVFQIMNPYEKKGQFTGISVAIRSFSNGQMCTRFCMKKSEEQKNYECMKHRLSSFPLLAKSYQYLNDMDAFTIFQDKVVLELNEELQKHLDEWQVDRIEVEGTNEWLQKRSQNIEDASWATRILVFHKRVK